MSLNLCTSKHALNWFNMPYIYLINKIKMRLATIEEMFGNYSNFQFLEKFPKIYNYIFFIKF